MKRHTGDGGQQYYHTSHTETIEKHNLLSQIRGLHYMSQECQLQNVRYGDQHASRRSSYNNVLKTMLKPSGSYTQNIFTSLTM
jgi:hypothetical protein